MRTAWHARLRVFEQKLLENPISIKNRIINKKYTLYSANECCAVYIFCKIMGK